MKDNLDWQDKFQKLLYRNNANLIRILRIKTENFNELC